MDLYCPNCDSTKLKKVSLVYQEGLFSTNERTRFRAVAVGGGPDLVVGRAATRGSYQTALSKQLAPPAKWAYLKLIFWSLLVFLCAGWLVVYVNAVTTNSSKLLSPPLRSFALISVPIFFPFLFIFWRHNRSIYPRQYAQWDESLICERCGVVSKHGRTINSSSD
jgi:hypothetical protein